MQDNASKFLALFQGLKRSRGVYHKDGGRMETKREEPSVEHVANHLSGVEGLGIVPVMDDEHCNWGAIDIDAHEDPEAFVPLQPIAMAIEQHGLPLILCQSKSKGAHLYAFFEKPILAVKVQTVLKSWAALIGHPGVEVFPKQKKLAANQVGNWINLPYFDADNGTIRYAYHSGKALNLDEFLALAELKRIAVKDFNSAAIPDDLKDAPPCVAHMLTEGIEAGERNNALFAIATYFKRRGDNDIEDSLLKVNFDKSIMGKPLQRREVVVIANSINRNQYGYRCNEAPICNLCDKESCKLRKYGVGQEGSTKIYNEVLFGQLSKVKSDPPRWIIEINEVPVEVTTEALMDYKLLRKYALERADLIIPPMKQEDWLIQLRRRIDNMVVIEAPDDAGPGAMIEAMLDEFIRPAVKKGVDPEAKKLLDRSQLFRGIPIMEQDEQGGHTVYFRGQDFIVFLKRRKTEEAKGAALWSILRKLGCSHTKLRIGPDVRQVWSKMVDASARPAITAPKVPQDF